MKNIKSYIEAKENVIKLKECTKIARPTQNQTTKKSNDEENNLEEDKDEDEFYMGAEDFMIPAKEERKSLAHKRISEEYIEEQVVRQTVGGFTKPTVSKHVLENDNEIQGFVQATANKAPAFKTKQSHEDFEAIFGNPTIPINPTPRYAAPRSQPIAPQPTSSQTNSEYAKFASFYATYRQPVPLQPRVINPNPTNYQSKQSAPPFNQAESPNPRPTSHNDIWQ